MAAAQYVITGTISGPGGKVMPFATIALERLPDSAIILTAISDSAGNYKIEAAHVAGTILLAVAEGYAPAIKPLAGIPHSAIINMEVAAQLTELKEANISARKPLIERKTDRVIFNVENSVAAVGSDALEAIGKAPSVQVSGSDAISLAGKSGVSVMIDDKLLQLDANELAEMLRAIPADNISRIEVITTPPARYDAAGNSGIINIVTKKMKKQGFNGNAGCSLVQNSFRSVQPSFSFNYRKNKWNIYGNNNGGSNYAKLTERQTTYYSGQQWAQVNTVDNLHNFHWSEAGIDYSITPRATFGILYTYGGSTPHSNEAINGKWINNNGQLDSVITTNAHTNDFGERNVVNLNYEWKIDSSGKKLNIDGDFFTRTGRTVRGFTTIDMFTDGTPTGINSTNKSTGKQVLYISSLKADMELPLKMVKVAYGGKASFIHVISDNVFETLYQSAYITDTGKTNKFDYQENTQALYVSVQRKINKLWDIQAGLRAEYTQTRAANITSGKVGKTNYLQLFPTAYIQYKPDEDNVLNLNYSRRVERPNMGMINPFRRYNTPNAYEEGNPFLQPSFTSNVELGYTLQSKYNFTLYTQYNQQVVTQILEIDSAGKGFHFKYANIGTSLNYGINASATLQPARCWECNIQFYGYQVQVSANYYHNSVTEKYARAAYIIEADNSFTLNKSKTLLAEAGFQYSGTMLENYNLHAPNASVNAGFRALFLQKTLIASINASDIFRTEIIKVQNLYNGAKTNNYYDERGLRLNITWKFGNNNVKSKRERQGGAQDESRRA